LSALAAPTQLNLGASSYIVGVGRADPVEFWRVEFNIRALYRLHQHQTDPEGAHHGTVFGIGVVQRVSGDQTASPAAVLDHDGGVAGDVFAQEPADDARVGVDQAARAKTNDETEALAAIKVGHRRLVEGGERRLHRRLGDRDRTARGRRAHRHR
jgi:hypothetical protein